MNFNGLYFGVITDVYSPDNAKNKSGYQYEYAATITGDLYSSIPIRCIMMDRFATMYNSEEIILDKKSKVLVMFPRGDSSIGVILGATRTRKDKMTVAERAVYRNRINETEVEVGDEGSWTVRLRDEVDGPIGPEIEMLKDAISLFADKAAADNGIIIDKTNKKITIKTGDWEVTTEKSAKITIAGDANIEVKGKASIKTGDANIQTKKLTAKVDGNAEIKVSGKLVADAQFIELAGDMGQVVTTATFPTCYVTGAPIIGSLKVKAGS